MSLKFIDTRNYEWLSGIRRTGWVLLMLLIIALILCPVVFAPLVVLWFILLIISVFYEQHESQEMLESHELTANRFLRTKIVKHSGMVFFPFLFILTLSTVFHPERWWVNLLFLLFSVLMIGVFIVTKYSVWGTPGNHKAGNITNSVCLVGLFIPFLLPLPIFIFVFNYKKSLRKLNPVLNDYN